MYFDRHPPDGMKERAYALFEAAEGPFTLGTEGHFRARPVILDSINRGTSHAIFTVLTNLLADDQLAAARDVTVFRERIEISM